MNNSTTTETLPKSGHVNEVCKEWLVREDGALAYKLQSQEINDFYKGNRQRNAVVREDFPTALHEQIKEQETAQKQVEAYRRRLIEQEEHDKRVAKEIADKLERDIQEQQQRELLESEEIAFKMQEIYVNMPPLPPPAARDKTKPPPRPAKASTMQQHVIQNEHQPTTSNAIRQNRHQQAQAQQQYQHTHHTNQYPQQQQQPQLQYFADTNGYVGLSVNLPTTPQRQKPHMNSNHPLVSGEASSSTSPSPSLLSSSSSPTVPSKSQPQQQQQPHPHPQPHSDPSARSPIHVNNNDKHNSNAQPQYRKQHPSPTSSISPNSTSLTNNTAAPSPSSSGAASSARRNNVFDFINLTAQNTQQNPQHCVGNSPKRPTKNSILHSPPSTSLAPKLNSSVEELIEYSDVADSIRRYDINVSNTASINNIDSLDSPSKINKILSPSHENLLSSNEKKFQKLSPEKYDQFMGNEELIGGLNNKATEQNAQQHADDIEIYVDPCDYESLKEIGLPMEEIKEMSKKLKQEQKDALLAKRLQEMEANDGLSQEERDRMLAIEAQDKELARMLQEREKAKVKRAKEKARIRKSQQQQKESSCGSSSASHCGPLLPLPQDCLSGSKQRVPVTSSPPYTSTQRYQPPPVEDPIDMEAYSNPIDVIASQQRQPNGTLTNGSLTRDSSGAAARHGISNGGHNRHDDDIYTLPVDSCRPPTNHRPASLVIGAETPTSQQNSMTRSENFSTDSHGSLNGHHDIPPRMSFSKSAVLDQNSSPTPPYMPIQGTRRSNSGEERKKKTKDKCTHQ